MAANPPFMTICNLSPSKLPKIHDKQLLTLRWHSFLRWGGESIAICFAYTGAQSVPYDCLQPIGVQITKDAWPKIVDTHCQDEIESVSLYFLSVEAANTPIMYHHKQINF